MKKKWFSIFALMLCVCFCFAGCNLFPENTAAINSQTVVSTGGVTISREDFINGYNNYYSTFYSQSNGDSEVALNSLIKYLVSKELYLDDAKDLVANGAIVLSNTEKNYLWYTTYTSLITNIETFEEAVREALKIEGEEEIEDEREQESNFIYTPYDKQAKIVFNEQTREYEIVIIKEILVVKTGEDGKEEYEYVEVEEALDYDDSNLTLYDINYVFNSLLKDKLFSEEETLTEEQQQEKTITMEAIRRYIDQLKQNESGKGLSTDSKEVLSREIERIYKILYENMLINKLYEYKTDGIEIDRDDFLNFYLSKVKASFDRYFEDPDVFIDEITTTVGSANYYGSYGSGSNSIEDVFYVPKDNLNENFFYVTHIVVSLTETQVQQINELKEYCEANGKGEEYYQQEFNKIVPDISEETINKVIDIMFKLEDGTITETEYEQQLLSIIGEKLLMVDERDDEGYVTEEVMTVQEMIASLYRELDEIYVKYYGEANVELTLHGHTYVPTTTGPLANGAVDEEELLNYQNERADKFNEYIYKYSSDTGTIQIQTSIFGGSSENWYLYAIGDGKTDNGFVEQFVDAARDLFSKGEVTGFTTFLMQNWKTTDGVEVLQTQSTAISTMMYCGQVNNLFECFDDQKFTLDDLFEEEGSNGKYYSLYVMDQYRLGLTMNKTLFDLVFEEYYGAMYEEKIVIYEDEMLEGLDFTPNLDVIKDLVY